MEVEQSYCMMTKYASYTVGSSVIHHTRQILLLQILFNVLDLNNRDIIEKYRRTMY